MMATARISKSVEKSETKKHLTLSPHVNALSPLTNKNILITSGPTWVAIDDMRIISNRSTGEMGYVLANRLKAAGAKVTLLEGPVTHGTPLSGLNILKFCYFDEFDKLFKQELKKKYDCVIHAAAVSDFQLKKKINGKIKSEALASGRLKLELVTTPKLINQVKLMNSNVFLIGFKLESGFTTASAIKETKHLFSKAHCDVVVANFLKSKGYEAFVIDDKRTFLGKVKSKSELSSLLLKILKERL